MSNEKEELFITDFIMDLNIKKKTLNKEIPSKLLRSLMDVLNEYDVLKYLNYITIFRVKDTQRKMDA